MVFYRELVSVVVCLADAAKGGKLGRIMSKSFAQRKAAAIQVISRLSDLNIKWPEELRISS